MMGGGALLGDRAMMIHSQHDRVFMRSPATGGQAGGLSPETEHWLHSLRRQEFEIVLVETVGAGQEAMPFCDDLFDQRILVMPPDYGSRLQLQKVVMLGAADIVVVNKLVVSCTYRRTFWTAFGPRDLFHAFPDPARTS